VGNTIWVEIHGRPLSETGNDSSTVHRLIEELDNLSAKLGVAKLSSFLDYSELNRSFGDFDSDADESDEEEPEELSLEQKQAEGDWFDSNTGLTALRTLRQHLVDHFDDLGFKSDNSTKHWPGQLMDELQSCESLVEQAAAQGAKFRLTIVP